MTSSTKTLYAGHRFPPELISYTVWLYLRFPLSLRMVEEMLAFGLGQFPRSGVAN
jgi:putative transposase